MKKFLLLLLIGGSLFVAAAGDADAHWRGRRGGYRGYGYGHRGTGFSININRGYGGYGYYGRPFRRSFGVSYGYSPGLYRGGYYGYRVPAYRTPYCY